MKMMSSLQLWFPLLLIISLTFESPVAGQQHAMDMPAHSSSWEPTPKPLIPGLPPFQLPTAGLPKRVRCLLPFFPLCFSLWHSSSRLLKPLFHGLCFLQASCNMPGAVCQDPRFVGGDGVTFYFHGRKDQDFCLVSDTNLHINGHFIGKRNPKLTRDFTWVQSIGILFDDHELLVGAKRTSTWDDNEEHLFMFFDNTPLSIEGKNWIYRNSSLQISRTTPTNGIAIEVENSFRITATVVPISAEESRVHGYNITDDDCFAHLDLGFRFFNLSDEVDGVLGQTYRRNYESKIKVSANMPVMGDKPKYLTSDIFATDCPVSRFVSRNAIPVLDSGVCNNHK
ncbi:unnamed protein product [Lactuca virosa]|uniref:Root cap n=1 Tax=Lactuca virosa TaxID=75947 RepID=A0AAU9MUS9_9ASTR|nr:unnamed protein product [Lactuca virosa]